MTKRKTEEMTEADHVAEDRILALKGEIAPTINPVIEPPLNEWTEADAKVFVENTNRALAYAETVQAARERFALLREVLTHTHATARLPADLLRRIQEAVE